MPLDSRMMLLSGFYPQIKNVRVKCRFYYQLQDNSYVYDTEFLHSVSRCSFGTDAVTHNMWQR